MSGEGCFLAVRKSYNLALTKDMSLEVGMVEASISRLLIIKSRFLSDETAEI